MMRWLEGNALYQLIGVRKALERGRVVPPPAEYKKARPRETDYAILCSPFFFQPL